MATSNKKFNFKFDKGLPFLELDLFVGSALNQRNPRIKKVVALFDTGADFTIIPIKVVEQLKLVWTGRTEIIETYNDEIVEIKFYSVRIRINSIFEEIVQVGASKYDAIVGMDLITRWRTLINGIDKEFQIDTSTD